MARTKARKTAARRPARRKVGGAARKSPSGGSAAQGIRRLDADFMKAVAAKDAGALVAAFYAADAALMPPNHPLVSGRAAIQGFLQGLLDAGATGIRLNTQRIAAAGDLAWGRGTYTLSMTPPGGASTVDTGKYIVCYRRQPGGAWRAVADIFNSDGPGA